MKNKFNRLSAISMFTLLLGAVAPSQAQMTMPGQFAVSPSGAATYTIPIQVPPGVAGMEPKLALSYNSQGGNGLLGVGWSLSGLSSISRCPQTKLQDNAAGSVTYALTDRYCLDGQRLIAVSGADGADLTQYRTEMESLSKVVSYAETGATNGPGSFIVKTKAGLTMEYGKTVDSRIEAQGKTVVAVWALNKVTDVKGNYYKVIYIEDNASGQYYLSRIDYTGNSSAGKVEDYSVRVIVEDRTDISTGYLGGSLFRSPKRIKSVQGYANAILVKEYKIGYHYSPATSKSILDGVIECSGSGVCNPTASFTSSDSVKRFVAQNGLADLGSVSGVFYHDYGGQVGMRVLDLNGDGLPDILHLGYYTKGQFGGGYVAHAYINTGNGFVRDDSWANLGAGNDDAFYHDTGGSVGLQVADLNGDGLPDLLHLGYYTGGQFGGGYIHRAYINTGHGFTRNDSWADLGVGGDDAFFHSNGGSGGLKMVDLNGDGLPDLLHHGYYTKAQFGGGDIRRAYINSGHGFVRDDSWAAIGDAFYHDYGGQTGVRIVDLNGDGLPDMLHLGYYTQGQFGGGVIRRAFINNGHGFTSDNTWAPPSELFYQDAGGGTGGQIVDLNGDGLPDILHIAYYTKGQLGGGDVRIAYINTGRGFVRDNAWAAVGDAFYHDYGGQTGVRIVDLNGDGLPDMLHLGYYTQGQFGGGNIRKAFINTGRGFVADNAWAIADQAFYHDNGGSGGQLIDLNGDGLDDILHLGYYIKGQMGGGEIKLAFLNSRTDPVDKLATISIGLGQAFSITYAPLTKPAVYSKGNAYAFPLLGLQPPSWVVQQAAAPNGIGGTRTTQYSYGNLLSEVGLSGRGNLGFQWTQTKDVSTGLVSRTYYRQDFPYIGMVDKAGRGTSEAAWSNLGLSSNEYKFMAFTPSDANFASGVTCADDPVTGKTLASCAASAIKPLSRYVPYAAKSVAKAWDWNNITGVFTALPQSRTTMVLDNWGNATQVKSETLNADGSDSGYSKTTNSVFAPADTVNWRLGRLLKSSVTATAP